MAIVYRQQNFFRGRLGSLRASGPISTILGTTTGSLSLALSGLKVTMTINGVSGSNYLVDIWVTPTSPAGLRTKIFSAISVSGLDPSLGGISYALPHWGTAYSMQVALVGTTTVIASAAISTPAYVPNAPDITSLTPTPNAISIGWNAVTNASSYNVYLNGSLKATVTTLTYQFTGLNPATQYKVGVQALAPNVV